ncbi:MAG: Xaa-Pro peptidase family protein [Candidatus Methanomethylicus sp.]|nr:Xaa-Pro peptidase family protein [Candidatus Methanomethylicus sp.]
MDFHKRLRRLDEILAEKGLDGALLLCPENVFYMTGAPFIAGSPDTLLYLKRGGAASLIVWSRDYEETAEKVKCAELERLAVGEKPIDRLRKVLGSDKRVGFEEGYMSLNSYKGFGKFMDLVPLEGSVEKMRQVKDAEEVAVIEKAQGITDRAFAKAIGRLKEGMTELEAASELEYFLRREGGSSYSFDTIVASGHRAVYPHGMPGDKRAQGGEAVIFDCGVRVDGYCSDMTRTIFFGKPRGEIMKIYSAVRLAQEGAIAAAKPGVSGRELDAVARKIIGDLGYAKFFVHGLGHGVGLAIHEGPFVSALSQDIIVEGNIVTDEPGIYISGLGAVRIEDMLLITERGCRDLTKSYKEITIV